MDENTRKSLFKLRSTWDEIFPLKILYALDVRVNSVDPAWPVKPLPPNVNTSSIHVNPKFLSKSVSFWNLMLKVFLTFAHYKLMLNTVPFYTVWYAQNTFWFICTNKRNYVTLNNGQFSFFISKNHVFCHFLGSLRSLLHLALQSVLFLCPVLLCPLLQLFLKYKRT